MDVRCYERNFLADKYFVKSAEALDSKELEAKPETGKTTG
jgi:hypothetical protein